MDVYDQSPGLAELQLCDQELHQIQELVPRPAHQYVSVDAELPDVHTGPLDVFLIIPG